MAKKGYKAYVLSALALPGTRQDIQQRTGLAIMPVHRWTQVLHASGDIHIAGWHRPPKGPFVPRYMAGPGRDQVCKLQPFTESQICARYRARLRKEEKDKWAEQQDRAAAYARARRLIKSKKQPQNWLSALGL